MSLSPLLQYVNSAQGLEIILTVDLHAPVV